MLCGRFIREEQEMATVFFDQLPVVTDNIFWNTQTPDLVVQGKESLLLLRWRVC